MAIPYQPSETEAILIHAAGDGRPADFLSIDATKNDPKQGDSWGVERTIRAEIIYALATGLWSGWSVHTRGIFIKGAKIVGRLDLGGAALRCRLALIQCYVEEPINIVDAATLTITLGGSYVSGIQGERVRIDGSLFLNRGFRSRGSINLKGATIASQLNCESAELEAAGVALDIEGARVTGGVFLGQGFHAKGDVSLLRATVNGELSCRGGHFEKGSRYALAADGSTVTGGVFLSEGFTATGEVRMLGARISGQLICDGGAFNNPSSYALGLDAIRLDGDLSLGRGFVGNGKVKLNGATVQGTLCCDGGSLREGLWLERATIGSTLSLRQLALKPQGPVDLSHARIGQLTDDEASWPENKMLFLDGFEYGAIAPGSPTDAQARLRWLNLQRDFSPQSFQMLARALRTAGYDSAARKILIALEDQRSARDSLTALSRLGRLLYRTVGYGYEPRFGVLCWAALIVLFGSVCIWFGKGLMAPVLPHEESSGLSPLLYSLDTFLPIHAFRQAELWWPHAEYFEWCFCKPSDWIVPWGWLLRFWLCLEVVSGWALVALFAGASAGIVRRE